MKIKEGLNYLYPPYFDTLFFSVIVPMKLHLHGFFYSFLVNPLKH